jgi:CDP-glucose 4,6-dehydratase
MTNSGFWSGRRVLITGNTGFKGSWLSLWLSSVGARVHGYSQPPPTDPSLFESARLGDLVPTSMGDVADFPSLLACARREEPEIVFHMAAQPLVRKSYREPVNTYMTNVMGTVHLLEAARQTPSVRVIVNVTSDKCYDNREIPWGYRECDPMGGHDPYSSSKGCAELVAAAYRKSYFSAPGASSPVRLASGRAGNVIGGGDWAEDRLVPDVLEPLSGYLLLAEKLWNAGPAVSPAYNFGPYSHDVQPVSYLAERIIGHWPNGRLEVHASGNLHEAHLLTLDSTLAGSELGWAPRLCLDDAIRMTVEWYRSFQEGKEMRSATLGQIEQYASMGRYAARGRSTI